MTDLRVLEIFDSLQGEGYWTGTPMTFVRLAGCNAPELGLDCMRWCDTAGSWDAAGGDLRMAATIVAAAHFSRICLTGGEPLLQNAGVAKLVAEAHRCGVRVHLETNGTVAPPPHSEEEFFDWVVVSPKPPGYFVAEEWEGLIDELKLVVDERMDAAIAERLAAAHPEAIVSVQPVWGEAASEPATSGAGPGGASASTRAAAPNDPASAEARAVRLVMEHPDWRLSLQMHKFLGIR
jgi:organic radical activating enzyme